MKPNFNQTRWNRRRMIQTGGVLGAAAALGGFAARSPYATAQDAQVVSFYTPGGSPEFCTGFDTIAAEYLATVSGVEIEATVCGVGDQSFNEFLLARIAAGDPPDATILWSSPIALAARDSLTALDDWMSASTNSKLENWPAGVLASCQWNGKTYGLPLTAGSYAMVYNEELFEAKGLPSDRASFPKTFQELRDVSKAITQWDGDTLVTAGMLPPTDAVQFPIWAALNGGGVFDAGTQTYVLDSVNNIELLNWMVEWLDDEYKGDINAVLLSGNWTDFVVDGQPAAFQSGTLGIIPTGFWITGEFYNQGNTYERWNAASFPVGPSGTATAAGYWPNWAVVPASADAGEAAFGFLDYIGVEGMTTWFENTPDIPTNVTAPALNPVKTEQARGAEFATEITQFFRDQLEVAVPMWNSPIQDFANDQIGRALEQILAKASSPEDALKEAQSACAAELERVLAGA